MLLRISLSHLPSAGSGDSPVLRHVAPVTSFSGLRESQPDAYASYQRKYRAVDVMRDHRDIRREFEGRVLDVADGVISRLLKPVRILLDRLRPPAPKHRDKGTVAGVKRILVDFKRQEKPARAEVLRQEEEPPLKDARADFLYEQAGVGVKRANDLIGKTIMEVRKLYPDAKDIPITKLMGQFLLGLNYDPAPQDTYGWPNAAAISAENAVGTMLTGALTAFERNFFADPALARSVIWHEVGHLIQGRLYPWLHHGDVSGAIGEGYADLISLWMTNEEEFGGKPMPKQDRLRWGLGEDFIRQKTGGKEIQFLRHFFARAHDDGHEVLGDYLDDHEWPNKAEHDFPTEYVDRRVQDDGGVHLNASAINLMHYLITTAAFDGDIRKCVEVVSLALAIACMAGDPGIVLHDLASYEVLAARHLYGDAIAGKIRDLWRNQFRLKLPDDVSTINLPKPDFARKLAGFKASESQ